MLVACLALTGATAAQAARWQQISPGGKKAAERIEIDQSSIDRSKEGKIRLWFRQTYATRQLQEAWAFTYRSVKQLAEFDCKTRESVLLQRIHLDDTGETLKSETFSDTTARPVVPDTAQERVLNHACRTPAEIEAEATAREQAKAPANKPEPAPIPSGPIAWSHAGKNGPAHWGQLSKDYALCGNGRWQSPIDIRDPVRADLPPVRFVWKTVSLAIIDTGHTIQVNIEDGGHVLFEGEEYALERFVFRHPGEEMVSGKRAAMSVQFEHLGRKSGRRLILAVPLVEGRENRLVRTLWNALPLEPGKLKTPAGPKIDPGLLIPPRRDYSVYAGSLTTPPCTEEVTWVVFKQPMTLSKEQIADFTKVYRNNARPAQPANGRVVKSSR